MLRLLWSPSKRQRRPTSQTSNECSLSQARAVGKTSGFELRRHVRQQRRCGPAVVGVHTHEIARLRGGRLGELVARIGHDERAPRLHDQSGRFRDIRQWMLFGGHACAALTHDHDLRRGRKPRRRLTDQMRAAIEDHEVLRGIEHHVDRPHRGQPGRRGLGNDDRPLIVGRCQANQRLNARELIEVGSPTLTTLQRSKLSTTAAVAVLVQRAIVDRVGERQGSGRCSRGPHRCSRRAIARESATPRCRCRLLRRPDRPRSNGWCCPPRSRTAG